MKNLLSSLSVAGLSVAALAITASASQAASFTVNANLFTVGGSYSTLQDAGYTVTGGGIIDPAKSKSNTYLTPGADTVFSQSTKFNQPTPGVHAYNVISTSNDPTGATTPITISNLKGALSFLWGSVDTYNTITFKGGAGSDASYTGTQLAALFGKTANTVGNFNFDSLVSFKGDFDTAVLQTTGVAFEVAAVPEASGVSTLLLIGAVVGGFALKNRFQQA